jgi:hypothetical protein
MFSTEQLAKPRFAVINTCRKKAQKAQRIFGRSIQFCFDCQLNPKTEVGLSVAAPGSRGA